MNIELEGNDTEKSFICPITQSIMENPVIASDGFCYEKSAIENWLKRGNKNSPITGLPLENKFFDNIHLRSLIKGYFVSKNIHKKQSSKIFHDINSSIVENFLPQNKDEDLNNKNNLLGEFSIFGMNESEKCPIQNVNNRENMDQNLNKRQITIYEKKNISNEDDQFLTHEIDTFSMIDINKNKSQQRINDQSITNKQNAAESSNHGITYSDDIIKENKMYSKDNNNYDIQINNINNRDDKNLNKNLNESTININNKEENINKKFDLIYQNIYDIALTKDNTFEKKINEAEKYFRKGLKYRLIGNLKKYLDYCLKSHEQDFRPATFHIYLLKSGVIGHNSIIKKNDNQIKIWFSIISQYLPILDMAMKEKDKSKVINYMYIVGQFYLSGILFEKNLEKSEYYFKIAASYNCPLSFNLLGFIKSRNLEKEAYDMYKKAYLMGSLGAYLNIGILYKNGAIVKKDTDLFLDIMEELSSRNFYLADYELGCYYYEEFTNDFDKLAKAFSYFLKAAELGHIPSMEKIGEFFELGLSVTKDYTQAIFWYRKTGINEERIKNLIREKNRINNLDSREKIGILERTLENLQISQIEVAEKYNNLSSAVRMFMGN